MITEIIINFCICFLLGVILSYSEKIFIIIMISLVCLLLISTIIIPSNEIEVAFNLSTFIAQIIASFIGFWIGKAFGDVYI